MPLEFVVHLECQQGASRCLKGVSQQVFSDCMKEVSFKGVSKKFRGCFKEVARVF